MRVLKSALLLTFLSLSCASVPVRTYAQAPPVAKESKESEVQALQQQLDALQTQVADLQGQIKKLTSSDPPAASAPGAVATANSEADQKPSEAAQEIKTEQSVGKATQQYQTNSEDQEAAARYDNAPLDPKYPNYFRLPGTKTFLKIGGYAKSDFTFNPRANGDQERFIPSSFPIPQAANANNSTISVRPSRINLDFLVPTEAARTIRFFLEVDFFGSSSTTPRLRHAYAQGKNLLIGQAFSNFMDVDAGPDTLDFQGPNSYVFIRNPQMRYTFRFGKSTTASLSIEKPTSDVDFSTPQFKAQPTSPAPDGSFQIRHEMDFGHVQFSGLFRDISAFLANGKSGSVIGWGFNLAGLFKFFGKDSFVYQGAYGNGIERYVQDTSGLGIDASVISAQNPQLEALPVVGTYGGYQHIWFSKLRSSVVYGFVQVDNTPFQPAASFHRSEYSAVNLIWSPLPQLTMGTEFLYGRLVNKDNSEACAPRVQFSAKYNFMQFKSAK